MKLEAKDTVKKMIEEYYGEGSTEDLEDDDLNVRIYKAGIRETAEWLLRYPYETEVKFTNYNRVIKIPKDEWQAKLKEWGIVNCPDCDGDGRIQKFFDRTFSNRCPKCNGYGYVATEPLIK